MAFIEYLQYWTSNTPMLFLACCLLVAGLTGATLSYWLCNMRYKSKLQEHDNQHQQALQQSHLLNENKLSLMQQALAQEQAQLKKESDEKAVLQTQSARNQQRLQSMLSDQERKIGELSQQAKHYTELKQSQQTLLNTLQVQQDKYAALQAEHESQKASVAQERIAFDEKLSILQQAEKTLNTQFENLANKIFEQKSERFTRTSEQGIQHLLNPLKTQIDDFKRQINDQYLKEGQERAALKTEILGLKELNLQITQEAAALTNALKGDNKQQGNWGEVVLARILEESGLRQGHEYVIQQQLNDQEGNRFRPDVIVHLPNNKDIVIDSKVSLLAHEKVVNAPDEASRQAALKEHINSIKGHIKGLSKKDYQALEGIQTLDYVLMFIPIESAFLNAIEDSPQLIKLAMDNQIMLVSPTNLLVALRTINNIWQYEYQNQHANTIADKARKMYDKFAGFVADMEKIGKGIETLSGSYDAAMNKLSTGKGNLIRQAESFKGLGVSPTKSISQQWQLNGDNALYDEGIHDESLHDGRAFGEGEVDNGEDATGTLATPSDAKQASMHHEKAE